MLSFESAQRTYVEPGRRRQRCSGPGQSSNATNSLGFSADMRDTILPELFLLVLIAALVGSCSIYQVKRVDALIYDRIQAVMPGGER